MPRHITEYVLYRWRYNIGYILVGLMVATILVAATFYVPGGISEAEMASTVEGSRLSLTNFEPSSVIDLPYKLIQSASFALFGISILSIKLPSLILGLASLVGIILLLRQWFHMNIAVIAALIVITTSQFIFSSQDGTPTIMYIFMPTWLLLIALKISRQDSRTRSKAWDLLLVIALALSLYTPLSAYIVVALISATLLHPHLRYIVRKLPRRRLYGASIIGLLLLSPLIIATMQKPEIGLTLLGIPQELPNLADNFMSLIEAHVGFLLPNEKEVTQPVYTLPSILLMILGAFHLFKTRYTARSYTIASWILLLAPIIILNPSKTTITFVPVMLLIAAGLDELLTRWYSMFPRNPYARVAGLVPITLLVAGMALTGVERYFYTYRYSPPVALEFSDDLRLLSSELEEIESSPTAVLVTEAELAFYESVSDKNGTIRVLPPGQPLPTDEPFLVTRGAFYERDLGDMVPAEIITNGDSVRSDRLYLYKTIKK